MYTSAAQHSPQRHRAGPPAGRLGPAAGRVGLPPATPHTWVEIAPAAKSSTDDELAAHCLRGDESAWRILVQRYQRLVFAIVQRAGLDEHTAADVFQTVFTRLSQHLPRLQDTSRLQAWIVTTTKREALLQRMLGQRHVSMTVSEDAAANEQAWDIADDSPLAEERLSDLQQLNKLRVAVDKLDARSRNLLMLLFCNEDEQLSYQEIARRHGIAIGSIGPSRSRCLAKLRALMA